MSEEKFYMVKNDKGKYWDFNNLDGFWKLISISRPITVSEENAKNTVKDYGGHVVTLIEEPEKVVLTKEQAKIVEEAHVKTFPATFIANKSVNEILFMEAYVNGYTVAKEKKYMVELDGLVTTDGAKQYLTNKNGKWFACRIQPSLHQAFTDEELKLAPIWTQEINRKEVTDDEQ